ALPICSAAAPGRVDCEVLSAPVDAVEERHEPGEHVAPREQDHRVLHEQRPHGQHRDRRRRRGDQRADAQPHAGGAERVDRQRPQEAHALRGEHVDLRVHAGKNTGSASMVSSAATPREIAPGPPITIHRAIMPVSRRGSAYLRVSATGPASLSACRYAADTANTVTPIHSSQYTELVVFTAVTPR